MQLCQNQSEELILQQKKIGGGGAAPDPPTWGLLMHAHHINAKRFEFPPGMYHLYKGIVSGSSTLYPGQQGSLTEPNCDS